MRPLEKISEKIHRRRARGGLSNLLFAHSAVESLPSELDGIADELHVNFPWGSLLAAVAGVNSAALSDLRRICSPQATLTAILGLDPERDAAELKRLHIPLLAADCIKNNLTSFYRSSGFELFETGPLSKSDIVQLQTSWARRLKPGSSRTIFLIKARAL